MYRNWPIFSQILISSSLLLSVVVGSLLTQRILFGYHLEAILSGSMQPALKPGDLSIVRAESRYRETDIVSFKALWARNQPVVHRIVQVRNNPHGIPVVITKGDANNVIDPIEVPMAALQGRQVLRLPWLGFPFILLKSPPGFITLVTLLFLVLVVPTIRSIWRFHSEY